MSMKPLPEEVAEAKRTSNGWVYRIAGHFAPEEYVLPEAIIRSGKVDANGEIIGCFIANQKYDSQRWPASNL